MIAKAVKGKGFRGALDYDLIKEQGRILDTNMAGETPRELAAEFGEIRKLRPNLGKAVLHVSLSAAPGEKLTDAQWREIGQRYLDGMGLEKNQYVMTRHTDTEHEHIHIVASRIRFDGGVTSDSQDWRRQEGVIREIERDFGLQWVAPSQEAVRHAPTKGEIERSVRTGEASTRQQLQQLADAAIEGCHSFTAYQERLEAVGVKLVPVVQLGGAKLSGLSYRLDGVTMKGSDLGRGYSPAGLAKRGVTYEQSRDLEAVRRGVERGAGGGAGQPGRGAEAGQAPERKGAGRGAGAAGAGAGGADGRDAADAGRDRGPDAGAGRDVQPAAGDVGQELEGGHSPGAAGGRPAGAGREPAGVDALCAGRGDGADYGGARERVLALAGAAEGAAAARREGGGRVSEAGRDRSLEAVQKQVAGLGVERLKVEIRDAKSGEAMVRAWSGAELMHSMAWLKRMNARGSDIHVRPTGEHGLVLVDGLKAEAIERMKREGFAPAATVEASPGSFQTWVRLSEGALSAQVRRVAAEGLARHYGGEARSGGGAYGRLAGLTNQAPEHTREGRQPYVLAHDCPGWVATKAPALLERVEQALDQAATREERQRRLEGIRMAEPEQGMQDPVREYRRQAQRYLGQHGVKTDFACMDEAIASEMARNSRFTLGEIERGIREGTPNVKSCKVGHMGEYAKRIAEKAWATPEVQQRRQEKKRQLQRGRSGPSLGR
jgi:hypothetical protein